MGVAGDMSTLCIMLLSMNPSGHFGTVLVLLSSTASWAQNHGHRFLDSAVLNLYKIHFEDSVILHPLAFIHVLTDSIPEDHQEQKQAWPLWELG